MSKRRKDRKKRRAAREDVTITAPVSDGGEPTEDRAAEFSEFFCQAGEKPSRRARAFVDRTDDLTGQQEEQEAAAEPAGGWFYQNRENLLLGLLVFYVLLLGLGTAGELFEIEWILNLPVFK